MMYHLYITDTAQANIHEITQWYEDQQASLGWRFREAVFRTVQRIHERPLMYPVYSFDARRALVKDFPYIVLYGVLGDVVSIVAVFDGRQRRSPWRP